MPPVKIYTLSTCGHCKSTKRFLDDNDVRYDFVDVDLLQGEEREKVIDEVKQINSRLSFPTIIIGDTIIVGFKEDQISEALGL
ncbi:MAG: glutaredoxin family protein [Desulfatibacillaceae bacterium]|nr:glutaredoxin family protein [Desulfatibacillaceae bacterium]